MEFSNLGRHCACPDCNLRDFLPFECNLCKKSFCLNHRTYESHECDKYTSTIVDNIDVKIREQKERKKQHPKCIKCKIRNTTNIKCSGCGKYTCISHRYELSHNCKQIIAKKNAKQKASFERDALNSNASSYTSPYLAGKFARMNRLFNNGSINKAPNTCKKEANKGKKRKSDKKVSTADNCIVA